MDLTSAAARKLAGKSSRRQFFKFLGVSSLGAGLFLTRTGVSLGAVEGCVGCGGGHKRGLSLQDLPAVRRLSRGLPHLG